jgi:hypothetical protein
MRCLRLGHRQGTAPGGDQMLDGRGFGAEPDRFAGERAQHVTHQKREREAIRDGVVHAEYDDRALGTMQQRGAQQRRS